MKGTRNEFSKWLYQATDLKNELKTLRELNNKAKFPKYQSKIQETIEKLDNILCIVLDGIQSVPDPVIRRAMEMVYLDGKTIEIASAMYPCSLRTMKRYLAQGQQYVKAWLQQNNDVKKGKEI